MHPRYTGYFAYRGVDRVELCNEMAPLSETHVPPTPTSRPATAACAVGAAASACRLLSRGGPAWSFVAVARKLTALTSGSDSAPLYSRAGWERHSRVSKTD